MAGFVSKQPNGLYCRFSSVTDCPTAWNMTREDYINMKMQEAKEDVEDVLDNYLKPFDMVVDLYYPYNMTKEEFWNSTLRYIYALWQPYCELEKQKIEGIMLATQASILR